MSTSTDRQLVRDLARRYVEAAADPLQDERRRLWRRHNSLRPTRPLLYARWFAAWQEHPESQLQCEDRTYRGVENWFRQMLVQHELADDYILEPWYPQRAVVVTPPGGVWGLANQRIPTTVAGGSWQNDPPLKALADLEKLVPPHHVVDEERTAALVQKVGDAIGDLLPIDVDRSPAYTVWHGDLSTDLGYLRGIEQFMWDMHDHPEWLHRLLAFFRDGILRTHAEAAAAGHWSRTSQSNQAMCYAEDLPDPTANSGPVDRRSLWVFTAAQEYTLVSPQHHDEFLLQYQLPIVSQFGLCAYGCCEDLTRKIDLLRQIPNLRRIAVTPVANVARSAEQIGTDYVASWRPNPAEMICCGFDPDHVRKVLREGLAACRANGCTVDICLKDVQTIQHNFANLKAWVRLAREVADEFAVAAE